LRETDSTPLREKTMLTDRQIIEIHSHFTIFQREIYLLVLDPDPAGVGSHD
jgi:hypothetical protein